MNDDSEDEPFISAQGVLCRIPPRNVFYDRTDPKYWEYIREGQAYTDRINHETALECVRIALEGPESNQTDPAKLVELVTASIVLDVLNIRWGGRQVLVRMLMQNALDSLPKKERRGRR